MSAVTLREVLTLPALRGCELIAGAAGIDREVTGVNVMEVPDIESFVEPGEVLLTTAYPLREHPEELGSLVRALARLGLAALAVKTGRYLDRLPQGMLTAADEVGLPLVLLRDDTSFNEVIGAVLAVVLSDYGADPAGAEAIRERLTGVALSGGGLEEIARTLGGALERHVDIVDMAGVSLVPVPDGLGNATADAMAPHVQPWSFSVSVAGSERARVLVGGVSEPTLGQRRLIRQACFAAGMHIAQALAGLELDRRMRVISLEALVGTRAGDQALAAQRARLYGWDLVGDRVVAIVRAAGELPEGVAASTADAVFGRVIAWSRGSDAVAIIPAEAATETAASDWRARLVAEAVDHPVVALGTVVHGIDLLAASHAAAVEALTIASAIAEPVVLHDRLTVERAILALPPDELERVVERELKPLIEADRSGGTDLCGTLDAFLATGNAAEAARGLFIHYNTMKHRMTRIEELLGERFRGPGARLALGFALRARRFLPPEHPAASSPTAMR